jgi:hypothetical protein
MPILSRTIVGRADGRVAPARVSPEVEPDEDREHVRYARTGSNVEPPAAAMRSLVGSPIAA